ncbi:phosphoribosylamine--glycine ligase [Herpetosiphon llansteffanensis]|uniref:phosphoribosylamine--glycine ligase n=1 Tax=Herpetosiphon llansteffanensis TaxID=2094568 RepID=UPI000D7C7651|nr:phosphoribosylglycinamide synthetase C domain-containing protein [Herpetosiphon llansteffanensis]
MKVLVLGNSGAAHAYVWKLFNSQRIDSLATVPGNGGTSLLVPNAEPFENMTELAKWAYDEHFQVIVPAEGSYLSNGLADAALMYKIPVCGPPKQSAVLERSRLWLKEFLNRHQIPTSTGRALGDLATAERYVASQPMPIVLWGDYPSEYDGAYTDRAEALAALAGIFALPPRAGHYRGVVIEQPALGPTVALSALTDGTTLIPMQAVRIYDRLDDNDQGWAAEGMGAHTTPSGILKQIGDYLSASILEPIRAALLRDKLPWWGILGVDCAITSRGPQVLRIRTTLSDPEAQVLLPLLEDDLFPLLVAANNRSLLNVPALRWRPEASVGVTMVASGYPHSFSTDMAIDGIAELEPGVVAFQNETANPNGLRYVSEEMHMPEKRSLLSGVSSALSDAMLVRSMGGNHLSSKAGRIVTVTAQAATLADAHTKAYQNLKRLRIASATYRNDIGLREL